MVTGMSRLDLSADKGDALPDMFTFLHNKTSPAPGDICGQRLLDLVVVTDFYAAKDALAHHLQTIVANVNTDDIELSKLHPSVAMRLHDKSLFTRIHAVLVRHYNWPAFEAEWGRQATFEDCSDTETNNDATAALCKSHASTCPGLVSRAKNCSGHRKEPRHCAHRHHPCAGRRP